MQKTKKKMFVLFTALLSCLMFVGMPNPNKALAFGGEYTVTDAYGNQYTKEAPTQIEVYYDSGNNLIVSGYSFFTNTQQYLSKGTGSSNTHYYRLQIEGTNFVYNDTLAGGDNYTAIAEDSGIGGTAGTGDIIYCSNGYAINGNGAKLNTQLQQVSFRFVIPANDLKKLAEGDYRLVLEHNLTNVKFKSTGNNKYSRTFYITKLIDANLTQNNSISKTIDTDTGKNKVEVSSIKNFNTLRVNASAVLLRNSKGLGKNDGGSGISGSSYNGGYWTTRYNSSQREIYHKINGSVVKNGLLGEYLIPMECTYNKTTTSSVDISLNELFVKKPYLETEYYNNLNNIYQYSERISAASMAAWNCKSTDWTHIKTSDGYCDTCFLNNAGDWYTEQRDALIARNAEIKAMCHTTSSSTSEVTETYYCKAIYTEADVYWTSIKVTNQYKYVKVISRTRTEKADSTELGGFVEQHTSGFPASKSSLSGNGVGYNFSSTRHGIVCPSGYHVDTVSDNYTNLEASRITLPYSRKITVKDKFPVGYVIYVDLVFRNDAPAIKKK